MARKEFNTPAALIEASRLADKVSKIPKRKTTLEAFTGKKQDNDVNKIMASNQHHPNTVTTPSQHHVNTVTTPLQHHANSTKKTNSITTPSQQYFRLSKQQLIVYDFLLTIGVESTFNKPFIEKNTGISYGTIRDIIRKFQSLTLIQTHYDKSAKCYEYKINTKIKIKRDTPNTIPTPFQHHSNTIPTESQNYPNNSSYSSSSLINKTTTKLKTILSDYPEFGYWRQKGLTPKQITQWIQLLQCDLNAMIQYLCYCRFEMVDLDFEKSKPVDNVFNWFFRIIEKIGAYPKPKGYKSFDEKQLGINRQIAEQKEKDAIESKELYKRKIEAEQDKKFWDMMNDPDSDLYKQCFKSLNSFQKKRTTGEGFEMSMRGAFDKLSAEGKNGASEKSEIHFLHQKKGAAKKER